MSAVGGTFIAGESSVAGSHLRLGDLIALEAEFPGCQRKTTSFTMDSAWASGGRPETVVFLDSATARTVTLNAVTGDTTSVGATDGYSRRATFINIGTAYWAMTPSSGTIEGLSTIPVAPGQRLTIQAFAGTGAGYYVSHSYIKPAEVTLTDTQIKALPTTAITIVAAPPSGYRVKVLSASFQGHIVSVYTGIDATYAAAALHYSGDFTQWAQSGIVDDSGASLTRFTSFFGTTGDPIVDTTAYLDAPGNGWTAPNQTGVSAVSGVALAVKMDNNGSGNLGGGNGSNTLKVTVYYSIEAVA